MIADFMGKLIIFIDCIAPTEVAMHKVHIVKLEVFKSYRSPLVDRTILKIQILLFLKRIKLERSNPLSLCPPLPLLDWKQ